MDYIRTRPKGAYIIHIPRKRQVITDIYAVAYMHHMFFVVHACRVCS